MHRSVATIKTPNKSHQNVKMLTYVKVNLKATIRSMMNKGTKDGIRVFPIALATRNWAVGYSPVTVRAECVGCRAREGQRQRLRGRGTMCMFLKNLLICILLPLQARILRGASESPTSQNP
jgi:hypothetical protein